MADKKISALTGATTPLAGTEVLPIVQGGATVKVSAADITAGRNVSMLNATLGLGGSANVGTGVVLEGTSNAANGAFIQGKRGGSGAWLTGDYASAFGSGDGYLVFAYSTNPIVFHSQSNGELLRLTSTNVQATSGNFVIGTTAKGLTTGSAIPLGLGINGAVTAVTIDTSNNVGVGTTSPGTRLDVVSAGNPTITLRGTDGAYTGILNIQAAGGGISLINATGGSNVLSLYTNTVERFRVGATGDATMVNGNLVIGTAAKGIDFSANSHGAGMTSELLNDYEEGTWTPTDGSGAGLTFTGTSGNCFYTKVGNLVTCVFGLVYPTTADLSGAKLAGLPFTSKATSNSVSGGFITYTNSALTITPLVGTNDTGVNLFLNTGTAAGNNQLSTFILRGIITYMV